VVFWAQDFSVRARGHGPSLLCVDLFVSRPSCVIWCLYFLSRSQFPGPCRNAQLAPFVPAAAGPDSFAAAVQFVVRQLFLRRPVLASGFGVAVRELLSS
jgi:hypothetical protein